MNLPNKLTLFRIMLVPLLVIIWIFPYDAFNITIPYITCFYTDISLLNILVFTIFGIASITDMLDGMIARKYNLITTFGKFADPIADKLLVNTVLLIMADKNIIPMLPVMIMLLRDIVVDGCRMMASSKGVIVAAGILGKIKTITQMGKRQMVSASLQ